MRHRRQRERGVLAELLGLAVSPRAHRRAPGDSRRPRRARRRRGPHHPVPDDHHSEGRLTDNLLALVPRTHQHMAAAVFRTVFAQPDADAVRDAWDEVAAQLGARFPKVAALMADAKPEVLAFAAFPRAHWQKIWSTNPLERINKEIKRRSRVVGIFPNEASAIRLVGAILADLHDEWQATERRYLSEHSMATLSPERDDLGGCERADAVQ